jgi:hypothetical protein
MRRPANGDTSATGIDIPASSRIEATTVAEPIVAGVDTIAISYRIPMAWYPLTTLRDGGWTRGFRYWGIVEICAPKRLWGQNVRTANAAEAISAVADAMHEALDLVSLTKSDVAAQPNLTRIDVARDFVGLEQVDRSRFLNAVVTTPRRRSWQTNAFGHGGATETVYVGGGPETWRAALYDKGLESGLAEAHGLLRVEARCRRRTLVNSAWARNNNVMIDKLVELNDALIDRLSLSTFERVGLGEPVRDCTGNVEWRLDWHAGVVEERRTDRRN